MRALLASVPGVQSQSIVVHFEESKVDLQHDPNRASMADLVAALESGGYQAWSTDTEIHQKKKP